MGYIILPVVVPSGVAPEEALKDNERYRVVWQVLQALRSHDDRFHAMVNQIELNKRKTPRLVIDLVAPRPETVEPGEDTPGGGKKEPETEQLALDYGFDGFRDAMYARIVQKVGERRYWETWAKDVSDIAQAHITRIKGLLADPESSASKEFEVFLAGLRGNLNDQITADEAIEMLAQHQVTRPIFEALFEHYDFAASNPVAKTMELMLDSLDEHNLDAEAQTLETFYASVRRRVAGVDNAEGKQRILIELYDKFFSAAFKKTVDKLGIVYTPVEIVDFIIKSADDVLRQEFGQGLTDEGVHILDGFTGTGTFLVRLLQSGLIKPHDLARKYAEEIHGNEILLLAYYIAAVNIETTHYDLTGQQTPFPGLILTDTFQSWEPDDRPDLDVFPENNARLEQLKSLPITVIMGNPPYSSGQDSANDDNANERYPSLDGEIRRTYADRSTATNKNSLYDSYIRAIKWASLRVRDRGVVAYVTNGGFLESNTADGVRKSLADEFTSIYVYNLRGNQRTAGEQSRREGGKVFGGGSRATVAITVLVKNPTKGGPATVNYTEVADYLTAEAKLANVRAAGSVAGLTAEIVFPNEHGDWRDQRRGDFETFLGLGDDSGGVFTSRSNGIKTNRDSWLYGFSTSNVSEAATAMISYYNAQVVVGSMPAQLDATKISWTDATRADLARGKRYEFDPSNLRTATYRPFQKQRIYFDASVIERTYRMPTAFPTPTASNFGYYVVGPGSDRAFAALAVSEIPDLAIWGSSSGQFFPRWRYEQVDEPGMLDLGVDGEVTDGYRKVDNITDDALKRFQALYQEQGVTKDDIFHYTYGLLHSPQYRETFAADLRKMLPRIPFVRDFRGYAEAGRTLSELHLGYESVEPYPLEGLYVEAQGDPYDFYSVGAKKMSFGKPHASQKDAGERHDKTVIKYNDRITLSGIPLESYRYMLGSRSAIEWIIDRYYVKTDKASGIVNNPNDWSREVGNPRYILDLLASVVTVSIETMKIVDSLPPLDIIDKATT